MKLSIKGSIIHKGIYYFDCSLPIIVLIFFPVIGKPRKCIKTRSCIINNQERAIDTLQHQHAEGRRSFHSLKTCSSASDWQRPLFPSHSRAVG